jgi:hypothetical protein
MGASPVSPAVGIAMPSRSASASPGLLLLAAAAIVVAWQVPYGPQLLYPLSLLATFAHEMGHGLAALLVGGEFDRLSLHADGSGLAHWRGDVGRLARVAIAAGGLLGPSVAGVALLLLAGSTRRSRLLLWAFAGGLVFCAAMWVRNPFGIAFLLATAAVLAAAGRWLRDSGAAFLLHLLAAVLCLSWFRDLDYMFSANAVIAGVERPSDTAVIAQALWLPYWFWGAMVAALSLALLLLGLWIMDRRSRG